MAIESSRLAKRAAQLRISAISLAENMRNGYFKSLYRGQGIEFSDVREYQPFDNIRSIDWNVTARMGRAFIKQYEEDRELSVFFVLDCSFSMDSSSFSSPKLNQAVETTALLLLAAEHNSGAIGAVFFDGQIRFSLAPKAGHENSMLLLSNLDKLTSLSEEERFNGSCLPNAIQGASKLLKKRSLVFILSDFRAANWESAFATLAQKNDLVAIRITSPEDEELPALGALPVCDSESRAKTILPLFSKRFKKNWREGNESRISKWKDFCIKHGAFPLLLSTQEDAAQVLSRFFKQKSR